MAKTPISKFMFSIEEEIIKNKETNTFSIALKIKPRWFAKPFLHLRGLIALIGEKYLKK